jgi:hypothetical protein
MSFGLRVQVFSALKVSVTYLRLVRSYLKLVHFAPSKNISILVEYIRETFVLVGNTLSLVGGNIALLIRLA